MPVSARKQQFNLNKLQKRLRRNVGRAIQDFNMIEAGDRVMVCLSGGKDSYTMLATRKNRRRLPPFPSTTVPGARRKTGKMNNLTSPAGRGKSFIRQGLATAHPTIGVISLILTPDLRVTIRPH